MMIFGVIVATTPYIVIGASIEEYKIETMEKRLDQLEELDQKTVMALFDRRLAALEKQNDDGLLIQKMNAGGIGALIIGGGFLVSQHRKLRIELSPASKED
jgi:hypothetical protein